MDTYTRRVAIHVITMHVCGGVKQLILSVRLSTQSIEICLVVYCTCTLGATIIDYRISVWAISP